MSHQAGDLDHDGGYQVVDLGPVDAHPALGYIQVVPGFVILNIILKISVSKLVSPCLVEGGQGV